MNGEMKWHTCADHILMEPELTGIEQDVFACKNDQVKQLSSEIVWDPELNDEVVILAVGQKETDPVQEALNKTCGTCVFYRNCFEQN